MSKRGNGNTGILIVLIGGLAPILLSKKRALDSLDLKPAFPRGFRFNGTNILFELPFNAFNGSNGTLNIGGIDLRVYAEGQYIGRAFSAVNQRIIPFGQSVLTSDVFVSLVDLAAAIPGFINGVGDQAVTFQFRGVMNVEGFYVNVDVPLTFNLPRFR